MAEETAYEKYLHADKILSFQKKDDELVCDVSEISKAFSRKPNSSGLESISF